MQLPLQEINCRHDILPLLTTREVHRTEPATLSCFIDLTNLLDFVSRDDLFKMLPLIGCPSKLLSIVRSFHDGMMSTVQFDGDMSAKFRVKSRVKQGWHTCSNPLWHLFTLLLKHAYTSSADGVYLHSRSDGCLFNVSRLCAKTETRTVTIRDLFADDVAMISHQEDVLQILMDKFSDACDFLWSHN